MKNNILPLICILMLLSGSAPKPFEDPLHLLTEIATTNHLDVAAWEVTFKESKSSGMTDDVLNNIEKHPFSTRMETENSIQYHLIDEINHSFTMTYQIINSKTNPDQLEINVVISGSEWNENIQSEYNQMKKWLQNNLFHNPRIFTCITIEEDDIIEDRAVIELYMKSLGMQHQDVQEDSLELSKLNRIINGYTPIWDEKILMNGIPYNLQIAVNDKDSGRTAYTIGTPILVNEY